jgi:hypothetical protein
MSDMRRFRSWFLRLELAGRDAGNAAAIVDTTYSTGSYRYRTGNTGMYDTGTYCSM